MDGTVLQRFSLLKAGLGMVIMGRVKAPADPGPRASEMQRTRHTALTYASEYKR